MKYLEQNIFLYTQQDGEAVTLKICIREVFRSNLGQDTGYTDACRHFSQFL
jgi:hypothetical protein